MSISFSEQEFAEWIKSSQEFVYGAASSYKALAWDESAPLSEIAVLEAFISQETPLTGREIAQVVAGNNAHNRVDAIVHRLKNIGVLSAETIQQGQRRYNLYALTEKGRQRYQELKKKEEEIS